MIEGTTYLCTLCQHIALGAHVTSTLPLAVLHVEHFSKLSNNEPFPTKPWLFPTFLERRKICSGVPEAQGFWFQTQNHRNHMEQLGTDWKQPYQR